MSAMKIKAILFDLGKVIVDFNFEPAFKRLSRYTAKTPEEIKHFFMNSGLEVLYDGGKISSRDFYRHVKSRLKHRADYHEFKSIWNEIFTLKKEMLELIQRLKPHYRIVLISNTNAMHYAHIRDRYRFFHLFHKRILSYKEKVRKPDEKIYKLAVKACQAKPSEIFYIDDRQDLTDAAKSIGIHAFTFKDNFAKLKKELKKKGVHHA